MVFRWGNFDICLFAYRAKKRECKVAKAIVQRCEVEGAKVRRCDDKFERQRCYGESAGLRRQSSDTAISLPCLFVTEISNDINLFNYLTYTIFLFIFIG